MLALAYINSNFQTGLKNILDRAVLADEETHAHARISELAKVDEIPFDFERRIMSVMVRTAEGKDRIISKGAPEAIFERCESFRLDAKAETMDHPHIEKLKLEHERLSAEGFRVLAIATRDLEPRGTVQGDATPYGKADERELVLEGYVAFLDPPKETAAAAIRALQAHGVTVKVITGDNELVSQKVCHQVGLAADQILLGDAIEKMTDEQLADSAESRASWFVTAMSVVIMLVGLAIPFSPLGPYLGFTRLPSLYWWILGLTLVCYVLLTQSVKMFITWRKWV